MQSAIAERLGDLENVARQLREVIETERPGRMLPGMVLCRVAVTADKAAAELAGLLDCLASATDQPR
jgi:hypothetical protein